MLRQLRLLGLAILGAALAGCSSLGRVDQSLVNHPAMDLRHPLSPPISSYLAPYGSGDPSARSSGVCTACAH
jgi:hypothetical protein